MMRFKKEQGSATIEATISLTLFVFVIMAIYLIVNFCIVQAKVAYAINATAKEMSQYSYFYHTLGLDSVDSKLAGGKQQAIDTFDDISALIDNSNTLLSDGTSASDDYLSGVLNNSNTGDSSQLYEEIQKANNDISGVINNPQQFLKSMACIAGEKIWDKVKTNVIAAPLAKGMTQRHFGKNESEANAYLESLGVVGGYDGINFNMSTLFEDPDHQDIQIVAVYNMDFTKWLPFDANITICQTAVTRAWLGGDMNFN